MRATGERGNHLCVLEVTGLRPNEVGGLNMSAGNEHEQYEKQYWQLTKGGGARGEGYEEPGPVFYPER